MTYLGTLRRYAEVLGSAVNDREENTLLVPDLNLLLPQGTHWRIESRRRLRTGEAPLQIRGGAGARQVYFCACPQPSA